ncbi:MAG: L-2-amino-thiazoline-4-carboxylic acid hydrolase [Planctomycetota bacterium]|jgi:hypothetical protein|nr:L-2-amino-thiazoline-4-carboxylic acid hydrolase [Planctomycetota bacterium]
MTPSIYPWNVLLKIRWIAFKGLIRGLGLWGAIHVGWKVECAERRGEPWEEMEPPSSPEEAASREQAGGAILLYRELCRRIGDEQALALTRTIILDSSVPWMRYAVGSLDAVQYRKLSAEGRKSLVQEKSRSFFNMTIDSIHAEEDGAGFVVRHCRFPELCQAVGVPQLAPLFCEVDAHYFGGVEPSLVLSREETLATGGKCCPFVFHFNEPL